MNANALLGRQVNFTYEIRLEPVQALSGRHQFSVQSMHYAARRPGPQQKVSISATRAELIELHRELGHYLCTHPA